jgi:hypothetical protein
MLRMDTCIMIGTSMTSAWGLLELLVDWTCYPTQVLYASWHMGNTSPVWAVKYATHQPFYEVYHYCFTARRPGQANKQEAIECNTSLSQCSIISQDTFTPVFGTSPLMRYLCLFGELTHCTFHKCAEHTE